MPTITPDVARLIEAYRTCEFLTVSRSGYPMAWPTAGVLRPSEGTFVISTSIGLAQKAINVRRDPRVAMLFSDPTGSGVERPLHVLVQGSAVCPDIVETGFVGYADLWRRLLKVQRGSQRKSAGPLYRATMDAYFMRLFITVTPAIVTVRSAPTQVQNAGQRLRRHVSTSVLGRVVRELENYESVVLAAFDESGAPTLVRSTVTLSGDAILLDVPTDFSLVNGFASILAHSHDAALADLVSFAATGQLTSSGNRWLFTPQRYVPGVQRGLAASIRFIRTLRTNAARYLARRNLPRPIIDWHELACLNAQVRGD